MVAEASNDAATQFFRCESQRMVDTVIVGLGAAVILYAVCFYAFFFFVSLRSALLWATAMTAILFAAALYAAVKLAEGL